MFEKRYIVDQNPHWMVLSIRKALSGMFYLQQAGRSGGMDETGLDKGLIVTLEDEEEIVSGGKVIRVVPAYKYL